MFEISIQRESLLKALRFVQKIVPNKPQLPILSSILIKHSKGVLSLSSTDLYFGIESRVSSTSSQEFEFAVPGGVFRDLINSLNSDLIKIVSLGDNQIKIVADKSTAALPVQKTEDYPEFPTINVSKISLSREILDKINKLVSFAAGIDQARPVLTTILLKIENGTLEAVATDGFRLAVLKQEVVGLTEKNLSFLVPSKYFSEVCFIASQSETEEVSVFVDREQKQLKFEVGNNDVYVRMIDGEYPPYEKIIPASFEIEFLVEGETLLQEIKRAEVVVKDSSEVIQLSASNERDTDDQETEIYTDQSFPINHLSVKAKSSIGSYVGACSLTQEITKPFEIAFKSRYIIDFLKNCEPELVEIGMNDALKPARFKIHRQQDDYFYVLMPFRLN